MSQNDEKPGNFFCGLGWGLLISSFIIAAVALIAEAILRQF